MQERFVIYTHLDQVRSQMVIDKLAALRGEDVPGHHIIAAEDCELMDRIMDGRLTGIALVDDDTSKFLMRHHEKPNRMKLPGWAASAKYVVFIGLGALKTIHGGDNPNDKFAARRAKGCALQLAADFGHHLQARLDADELPWGQRRKRRESHNKPKRIRGSLRDGAGCSHTIWM